MMPGIVRPLLLALLAAYMTGCKGFYSQSGSRITVGESLVYPDISESADDISFKLVENIKGAKIWTARDSIVVADYQCSSTNDYLGCIHSRSAMSLKVEVRPTEKAGVNNGNCSE